MTASPGHTLYARGSERWLGHGAMVLFAVFVAGSFVVGAQIVDEIASAPLNAVRFVLAAALMGAFAFGMRGHRLTLPKAPWRFVIFGALNGTYFVTMMLALTMAPPVSTSAVFTLTPLVTAIVAFMMLRQRVPPIVAASMALAATGALWVIFDADLAAFVTFAIGPGETIFLIGCIAYGFLSPLMRLLDRREPGVVLTFWLLTGTTLCIALYGAGEILATDWLSLSAGVWWAILYLAVFPTAVSIFLLQFATLRLPSSKVMAYIYLLPGMVIVIEGISGSGWASLPIIASAGLTVGALLVLALAGD